MAVPGVGPALDASYVLPLRRTDGAPPEELTAYLAWLAEHLDVLVVDGSPPAVFEAHGAAWTGLALRHVRPDPGGAERRGGREAPFSPRLHPRRAHRRACGRPTRETGSSP